MYWGRLVGGILFGKCRIVVGLGKGGWFHSLDVQSLSFVSCGRGRTNANMFVWLDPVVVWSLCLS